MIATLVPYKTKIIIQVLKSNLKVIQYLLLKKLHMYKRTKIGIPCVICYRTKSTVSTYQIYKELYVPIE